MVDGQAPIGKTPMAGLRLPDATRRRVEASRQPDRPSFSEAVRRLIDKGLLSVDDDTA